MITPNTTEDWATANQRCLMAELAELKSRLSGVLARGQDDATVLAPAEEDARCAMGTPSALDSLCALFGLSAFERGVLLLSAGPELDSEFLKGCADRSRTASPSFGLALAIAPEAHWDALAPTAPLRHWRMIEVLGNGPLTAAALKIDERILFYLTGVAACDERLVSWVRVPEEAATLAPSQEVMLERLLQGWTATGSGGREAPVIQLCGGDLAAKRSLAQRLCTELQLKLFRAPASGLPSNLGDLETLHRTWEREAMLQNAALLIECDPLGSNDPLRETAIDQWTELSRTPLLVSVREPRRAVERAMITVDLGKPTSAEQRIVWERALHGVSAADQLNGQLDRVIAQFSFGSSAIHAAAGRVAGVTRSADELGEELWDVCRRHARPTLEDLAQRIPSTATWSDLVLPGPQSQTLHEIAIQVKHRTKVCDDWGFAAQSSRGLGLGVLFAGPSGTGKTLAAEILANEMRLDLFRIDLSAVVSKYIGETEKNLRRVFDAAEEGGAVLLFDEADAIFGKRSEVKDSHDRYANVEVSYLLQRMEAYRGLAILTTNQKDALDPAFLRRLRFVVQFPFPDQAHRAEIWRRVFPRQTPVDGLDAAALSRLSIAGGNIRSIALNAAFAAADADEPVRMKHLLRAARAEYEKLEKPLTETEVGGWR